MSTSPIDVSSLLQAFGLGGGSNIDVNSIVSELMQVNEQPLTAIQTEAQGYQTKISAYGTLLSSVQSLQSAVVAMQNTTEGLSASSSNTSDFTATASNTAVAGTTPVNIQNIASAQGLFSTGFGSTNSQVADLYTSGTQQLQIQAGSNAPKIINIKSTNNTLSGLASAINSANAGVTATVVHQSSNFVINASSTNGTNGAIQNNTLYFDDGTGSKAITPIAAGNYSGAQLAAAIQNGLNTAESTTTANGYVVSFNATTNEFTIKNNSTNPLTIDWGSSTLTPQLLGLGFDPAGTNNSPAIAANGGAVTGSAVSGTYVLQLNSNSTGTANRITVKADETGTNTFNETGNNIDQFGISMFAFDPTYNSDGSINTSTYGNVGQSQVGRDAQLSVNNGILIDRPTNTISDVIPGVTLNLLQAGSGSLNVSVDSSSLAANLSQLVTAYNSTMSTISELYNPATSQSTSNSTQQQQDQGVLNGDSELLGLQQQLQSVPTTLYGTSSNIQNNYLASIGLTTDKNGVMSFSSSVLTSAYTTANAGNITKMINNFASQLGSSLDEIVNTGIPAAESGYQNLITNAQTQYNDLQENLTIVQQNLTTEYTQLQQTVEQDANISNYLTEQTTTLNNENKTA